MRENILRSPVIIWNGLPELINPYLIQLTDVSWTHTKTGRDVLKFEKENTKFSITKYPNGTEHSTKTKKIR